MASTKATVKHDQDVSQVRIPVILPDMFVSFLSQKPSVNPHYEKVKRESEAWINRSVRRCANLPEGHRSGAQQMQLRRRDAEESFGL